MKEVYDLIERWAKGAGGASLPHPLIIRAFRNGDEDLLSNLLPAWYAGFNELPPGVAQSYALKSLVTGMYLGATLMSYDHIREDLEVRILRAEAAVEAKKEGEKNAPV